MNVFRNTTLSGLCLSLVRREGEVYSIDKTETKRDRESIRV